MRALLILLALATSASLGCNPCDGDVSITNVDELNSVRGCPRIEGDLTVGPSDLEAIDSLAGLRGIAGDLYVTGNTLLKDLDGLIEIVDIGGSIHIVDNGTLQDFSGTHQLTLIAGDVEITDNPLLIHLAGIIRVSEIAGSFTLERNDRLDDLQGLRGLVNVAGSFTVSENAGLLSLDGADDLTTVGDLTIRDNAALPPCAARDFVERVEVTSGAEADVDGNDGTVGCS